MARARGANAQKCIAFESVGYGIVPNSGFFKVPFVSSALGEQQDLVPSDLLGMGRDPAPPSPDVVNDDGDIVVPVDARNFGLWLKAMFGAPTTTQGSPAAGSIVFTAQPANNATVTIGGADFTFVNASPTGDECLIGATLLDTLTAAVLALNASATTAIKAQRYELGTDGVTINIISKTIGTSGNSVTLAKSTSPASNATVSGANLAGGATSGNYNHVFASGAITLPSFSDEVGNNDVPTFAMNYGGGIDKLSIPLQRSGLLNATLSAIAQGEKPRSGSTAAGTPTELAVVRFAQGSGKITRSGVSLGDVVSGSLAASNNLDKVEVIRDDGRIAGIDPGEASYDLEQVLRFKDTVLMGLATNGTPIDLSYGWKIAALGFSLTFTFHEVYLPKPKVPITGPGGIQATYSAKGAKNVLAGRALTVTLVNDVASYA